MACCHAQQDLADRRLYESCDSHLSLWDSWLVYSFFFGVCLSYCIIRSSKLHNGFSLHLVSSKPHAGMHARCLWQLVKSSRVTVPWSLSSLQRTGTTSLYARVLSKEPSSPVLHHMPQPFRVFLAGCAKLPRGYQQKELYFPPSWNNWSCQRYLVTVSDEKATFTAGIKLSAVGNDWTPGAQGLQPTPKASFLTQDKFLCLCIKYAPADRGGADGRQMLPSLGWFSKFWIRAGCSSSWKPCGGVLLTRVQTFSPKSEVGHC